MNTPETKTAFVAIVGCPNVGKSSLLNKMIGQKVAIVTSKPQTTRTRIMGVLTVDETQLVFTDTPGYHRPHNKLGEHMNQAVSDSISGVDACLFVVEPQGDLRPAEEELLQKFQQQKMPVVLAINKIDTLERKEDLALRIAELNQRYDFAAVVPTCAVKGEGVDDLLDELKALAQPSVHFFPDDTLTDQPSGSWPRRSSARRCSASCRTKSRTESRSASNSSTNAKTAPASWTWTPSSTVKKRATKASLSAKKAPC